MVAEACGKNFVPNIMELGGKCPVVIDASADVDLAAKRICGIKFLNAGQVCLTADYVLCHGTLWVEFQEKVNFYMKKFFGDDILKSNQWSKVATEVHSRRQYELLSDVKDKVTFQAGTPDHANRIFPPTVVTNPS